jgi:homoserine kinase type II
MASVSGREQLSEELITNVLNYYDIGTVHEAREYPRGSRKAPKYLIRTDRGQFLLKRRARGKDDPYKVAFAHQLQWHLANVEFPLPHLIGTRDDHNSMLLIDGKIYELFEYLPGQPYDLSLLSTSDAGRTLALYHRVLEEFECQWRPPRGTYHNSDSVRNALRRIPKTIAGHDSVVGYVPDMMKVVKFLYRTYDRSAKEANAVGIPEWPVQIVHGDWHPGNLLYRESQVVAVIDYDAARLQQRVTDMANGTLQFSVLGGDRDDPDSWPDFFDMQRLKGFLSAYEENCVPSAGEMATLPKLMIQALIAECVLPIAYTGHFGKIPGYHFLRMVCRKITWLEKNADEITQILN